MMIISKKFKIMNKMKLNKVMTSVTWMQVVIAMRKIAKIMQICLEILKTLLFWIITKILKIFCHRCRMKDKESSKSILHTSLTRNRTDRTMKYFTQTLKVEEIIDRIWYNINLFKLFGCLLLFFIHPFLFPSPFCPGNFFLWTQFNLN